MTTPIAAVDREDPPVPTLVSRDLGLMARSVSQQPGLTLQGRGPSAGRSIGRWEEANQSGVWLHLKLCVMIPESPRLHKRLACRPQGTFY